VDFWKGRKEERNGNGGEKEEGREMGGEMGVERT